MTKPVNSNMKHINKYEQWMKTTHGPTSSMATVMRATKMLSVLHTGCQQQQCEAPETLPEGVHILVDRLGNVAVYITLKA